MEGRTDSTGSSDGPVTRWTWGVARTNGLATLEARPAQRVTDYLACCARPALEAFDGRLTLRMTEYLGCCARPALEAIDGRPTLRMTEYLACCARPTLEAFDGRPTLRMTEYRACCAWPALVSDAPVRPPPVPSESYLGRTGGGWATTRGRIPSSEPLPTISGMPWGQLRGMGCCPQVLLEDGGRGQDNLHHCARQVTLRSTRSCCREETGELLVAGGIGRGMTLPGLLATRSRTGRGKLESCRPLTTSLLPAKRRTGTSCLLTPLFLHSHHVLPTPPSFMLPASHWEAKLCSVTVHSVPHLRL